MTMGVTHCSALSPICRARWKGCLLVAMMCLAVPSLEAQPSEAALLRYARDVWDITDHTDEILAARLAGAYEGIPYKDWITFAISTRDAYNDYETCVRRRAASEEHAACYVALANVIARPASELGTAYALKATGLSGVAAMGALGSWFIQRELVAFFRLVNETALDAQVRLYVEARRCGLSQREILRRPSGSVLPLPGRCNRAIAKMGEWLFVGSWTSAQNPLPHGADYGADDVFAYAEAVYQSGEGAAQAQRDLLIVGNTFAQLLSTVQSSTIVIVSASMPERKRDGRRWDGGFGAMTNPDPVVFIYTGSVEACRTPASLSNAFAVRWSQRCMVGLAPGDLLTVALFDYDPADPDLVGQWSGSWEGIVSLGGSVVVAPDATVLLNLDTP